MNIRAITKKIGEGAAVLAAITGVAWLNSNIPKVEYVPINDDVDDFDDNYYNTAVSIILKSNIFSNDKTELVSALPSRVSLTTYKAIASILNSNTFSIDKISMVKSVIDKATDK